MKNEIAVLERCFESVQPYIQHWVISDTGSEDGSPEFIERWFERKGIPGTLLHDAWRDFGYNRSRALAAARGTADYVLIMDADDILVTADDFGWGDLRADAYRLCHWREGVAYQVERLVRGDQPWRYEGVLHEYLTRDGLPQVENLENGIALSSRSEGARSRDPEKYVRDAEVLRAALDEEPDNLRYLFYLAQSYRDAGQLELALEAYTARAAVEGWVEEDFYARYQVACLRERLGEAKSTCLDAYLEAWAFRPARLEPLHKALRLCRELGLWALAVQLGQQAMRLPRCHDLLFVEPEVYRWRLLDEWAVALSWAGRWAEAHAINRRLLSLPEIPHGDRARLLANLRLCSEHASRRDAH